MEIIKKGPKGVGIGYGLRTLSTCFLVDGLSGKSPKKGKTELVKANLSKQ